MNRVAEFRKIVSLFLAAIAVASAGCRAPVAPLDFESKPRAVLSASGISETRSPQISVSPAGKISLLTLYKEGTAQRLGFTMSHDGGDHFMPLKPISEDGAVISAHGENNPEMAVSGRSVYALWEQSLAEGPRDIVVARSNNEGMSFEKPVRINDNTSPSFHGFASIAADAKGNVAIVWLDGREKPESPGTFDIYLAQSSDRGATFSPNIRVARSACPCCRPAVTIGPNGEIFVVWRKVFPGSIRDMVLSVSTDGGQTFPLQTRVAEDGWQINGCPESGAALRVNNNKLYVAWMTGGSDSHARVQLAVSEDGGQHFRKPQAVSREIRDPNHPVFAQTPRGGLLLAFQGRSAAQNSQQWNPSSIFVEEIQGTEAGKPLALANAGDTATYPDLAVGPTGDAFAVWTATGNDTANVVLLRGNSR